MPEITYTISEQGEEIFTVSGLDREMLCLIVNAVRKSRDDYVSASLEKREPMAGRKTWTDFFHYTAILEKFRQEITATLANADSDAESVWLSL